MKIETDENSLYSVFWAMVTIFLCCLTLSISSCVENGYQKTADMVKSGANPLEAYCALNGGDSTTVRCTALAAQK